MADCLPSTSPKDLGDLRRPHPLGSVWLNCGTIKRVRTTLPGFIFTEALEGKLAMYLMYGQVGKLRQVTRLPR